MRSQDRRPGNADEQSLTDTAAEPDAPAQSPLAYPFAQKKPSDRCDVTGETLVPGRLSTGRPKPGCVTPLPESYAATSFAQG
jgi:hypothetical protein